MWWTWTGDIDRILTADLNTGEPFDLLSELWEQISAQNPLSEGGLSEILCVRRFCVTE